VRFDELDRIKELISQMRARRESSVTGNGHGLAMLASAAGMSPVAALKNRTGGFPGIISIKKLDDSLSDPAELNKLAEQLKALHKKVCESPVQVLFVGEDQSTKDMMDYETETVKDGKWNHAKDTDNKFIAFDLSADKEFFNQYWVANTQINFCSQAYPAVPSGHKDSPALLVLGSFLKMDFYIELFASQAGLMAAGPVLALHPVHSVFFLSVTRVFLKPWDNSNNPATRR